MDWLEGYSASYYLCRVDPATWRDMERIDITGGNVTKKTGTMMESAAASLTDRIGEAWVRFYVSAEQDTDGGREAIFTGLLQCPKTAWDGTRDSYAAECYSVLKPLSDILLPRGWYVMRGTNGAQAVKNLLSVGPAPVEIDGEAPELTGTIVAENGETNLTMAWKILNAIGWRVRISGDGRITVCGTGEAVARLDTQLNDVVELSITDTQNLYSCPNVFRAINGDQTSVAVDESSVRERGREIWAEETSISLNSWENIADYALRRLKELQAPARSVSYTRRFIPGIYPGDTIFLRCPGQNINGIFRIVSQKIDLSYGAKVSEDVEQIINLADDTGVINNVEGSNLVGDAIVDIALAG